MGAWWTEILIGWLLVGELGRSAGSAEAISQDEFFGYLSRKGCAVC